MGDHFVDFLKTASESIDCALFFFKFRAVEDVLIAKHRQGVSVRIVSDTKTKYHSGYVNCLAAGIPIVFDTRPELMHNKFIIVDNKKVWTGSANVTEVGMYRSINTALLLESKELAINFAVEFEEMFASGLFGTDSPQNTRYPTVNIGGTSVKTFFAPEDDVLEGVLSEINKAEESIDFMMTELRSKAVADTLRARMDDGVRVRGFVSTQISAGYADFLRKHGASIYTDAHQPFMHSRTFVIDNETVVNSSSMFGSAIEKNDENVLILRSKEIAQKYTAEFNVLIARERWEDYTPAHPVPATGIPLHGVAHGDTMCPPILHLTMDDNEASQRVADSSERCYELVFQKLSGNPYTNAHSTPGALGTALSFDEVDDAINIPGLSIPVDRDCAIALWYWLDALPPRKLRAFGNYRWHTSGFFLRQHPGGLLRWNVMYGGGKYEGFTHTVTVGNWNHFVCQRNGGVIEFFVNGVLVGTYSGNPVQLLNGEDFCIGVNVYEGNVAFSMDDFRVYDRALMKSEIKALATSSQ